MAAAATPKRSTCSRKSFEVHLPDLNQTFELTIDGSKSVDELHEAARKLAQQHHVPVTPSDPPVLSRLLGLPAGYEGLSLSEMKLKAPHRLVLVTCPDHARHDSAVLREIGDTLGDEHKHMLRGYDEDPVSWSDEEGFGRRVRLRVDKYLGYIQLADLDASKRNLVLDIDFTILDTDVFNMAGCSATTPSHYVRPNLHEFLETVYPYYNLIVWSATGNYHVEHKLRECGLIGGDKQFKLALLIDYGAMMRVVVKKRGVVREFNTKPLNVLWGLFPSMHQDNTVIVDDHRRSFIMNTPNGIQVSSYRSTCKSSDQEFKYLAAYLLLLREARTTRMHHEYWREVASGMMSLSSIQLAPQELSRSDGLRIAQPGASRRDMVVAGATPDFKTDIPVATMLPVETSGEFPPQHIRRRSRSVSPGSSWRRNDMAVSTHFSPRPMRSPLDKAGSARSRASLRGGGASVVSPLPPIRAPAPRAPTPVTKLTPAIAVNADLETVMAGDGGASALKHALPQPINLASTGCAVCENETSRPVL